MTSLITSLPDAPSGSVLSLPSYRPSDFPVGSIILCRNSAPLVRHAYGLLQRDVPCRILGRDIGAALINIVQKRRAANLDDLQFKLAFWANKEADAALAEGRDSVAERIRDQHACLTFFIDSLDDDSRSVGDLLAKIELMFTDDGDHGSRVTLSTIHKAKGLEFPTVFILDRNLIPSKFARQPWQLVQERNLLYVAITRAMNTLIYINSGGWASEGE